ncbi:MAG TPA: SCO1664 family protein [Anaerolineaceae bacterium]|nr:SCO1664 family protein [Anaerolineaceae bacterium]
MDESTCLRTLAHGQLTLLGQFTRSSNFTFLASCSFEGTSLQAVYKPARGQLPLWDFTPGTLPKREAAAWLLCRHLGWDFIPPTVYRTEGLPAGEGSVQLFVEHDPEQHYFTLTAPERESLRQLALFDLLANNADRKGGHILRGGDGKLWAIDHALCFHEEPKLRTVIWDFAGQAIPEPLLGALKALAAALAPEQPFYLEIADYLSDAEISSISKRCAKLLADERFPFPDENRRATPWPPV